MNKRLVPITIVAAMSLLAAACGNDTGAGGDLSGQQLVVVNWGGTSGEAMQKGWMDPYSKETGVQLVADSPPDQAKVKAMVEAGNTTWDIVDFGAASGASDCGTLFEKRPDGFDISDIDEKYVTDDCGVPGFAASVNIVYNKELYGDNPPTSVEDFMDVKRFPGKRIFLNWADGQVEPLLMTTGLSPNEIYPIDWSKVESAAATLGDEMTPQDTVTAATQSLESGDYGMCLCYGGSMSAASENGAEFGILWDKTFMSWDLLYAVKGSKSPEAQWDFLQQVATEKGQAPFYQYAPYTSPLKKKPEAPEKFQPFLPAYQEGKINDMYLYDPTFWASNMDKSISEWTRIMAN